MPNGLSTTPVYRNPVSKTMADRHPKNPLHAAMREYFIANRNKHARGATL